MINKIIKCSIGAIIFLFFLIIFSFDNNSKAYASGYTEGLFCASNAGTKWGIFAIYTSSKGAGPWTIPTGSFADQTGSPCGTYFYDWQILGYAAAAGDTVKWNTACVDPITSLSPTYQTFENGAEQVWQYTVDITCSSDWIGGYPASCDQPTGWGYVPATSWCPSGPYCMYGGTVDSTSTSYCPGAFVQPQVLNTTPSSCGSGGTCNYYYCTSNMTCANTTDTTGQYCGSSCGTCQPGQICCKVGNPCTDPTNNNCQGVTTACPNGPTQPGTCECRYSCTGANNSCVNNPSGIYATSNCSSACPTPAPGAACNPPNVWKCTGNCSPVNGSTGWTCQDAQGAVCANNGFCQNQPCRPGDTKIDCSSLNYCHVPGTNAIVR